MTNKTRTIAKAKFIKELSSKNCGGNISFACKSIGFSRQAIAVWRREDQNFDEATVEAVIQGRDTLADAAEQALVKRVNDGNVTAIIFTLKCLRPERWNDKGIIQKISYGKKLEDNYTISPEFARVLKSFSNK